MLSPFTFFSPKVSAPNASPTSRTSAGRWWSRAGPPSPPRGRCWATYRPNSSTSTLSPSPTRRYRTTEGRPRTTTPTTTVWTWPGLIGLELSGGRTKSIKCVLGGIELLVYGIDIRCSSCWKYKALCALFAASPRYMSNSVNIGSMDRLAGY